MAHPWHHALASARRFGGEPGDYLAVHDWLDASKLIVADIRHRALRHHAEGCFAAEREFGTVLSTHGGRAVPTRLVAEQHIREDLGWIPSFADWVRCIAPQPWMGRAGRISGIDGPDPPGP